MQALAQAGPPRDHDPDRRARRPRPRVPARRARGRGRRLGSCRSTRSTSRTCSRPRTPPTACSPGTRARARRCPEIADADGAAAARAARRRRAPELRGDHGLRRSPRPSSTRRSPSCARRSARRHEADDHLRLRTALPALHRPVPQGRAEDRALPAADRTTARRTSRSRASRSRSRRSRTPRRSATWKRCARSGCPPSGCACSGDDPAQRAARTDRKDQGDAVTPKAVRKDAEDAVTQIGFVGLGKMGGNMVHRIRRDSEHEVVAFDFDEKAVKQAVKHGAVGASLAEGARQAAARRRGWCGSWCPPAIPPSRRSTSSPSCSTRDDTIVDGGNSKWTDDKRRAKELQKLGHPLRRRRHLRRRLGAGGRLLHDGRRPAESRQAAGADPRRARAGDQRAERRRDRSARLAALRPLRAPGTT